MSIVCGSLPTCSSGIQACLSYNGTNISVTHALNFKITLSNGDHYKDKTFHFKLSDSSNSGGICNYSQTLSTDETYNVDAPINSTISLSTYRYGVLPYLGSFNWYYAEYFVGNTPTYTILPCGSFGGFIDSVPVIPAVPVFNLTNAYNGYDSAKICVTSTTSNVQHWNVYRSATSGGTYTLIGSIATTGSTHCFYDNTVVTGQTYWYKVSAVNVPWEEFAAIQSITITSVVDNTCVIRNQATITNVYAGDYTSVYELWRATGLTATYQRVGHTHANYSGTTIAQDKITDYGVSYYYKIKQITPDWTLWSTETEVASTLSMTLAPILSGIIQTGTTSVDLSWTDSNTWQQNYEIWKKVGTGGTYTLLDTVTGTTYTATGLPVNEYIYLKIRGIIECFTPTYIYSPYSNEVEYSIFPPIFPPTGLTASTLTCTGGTLTWVNVNVSGQTGNYIYMFNGTDYYTIATLPSGDTSYDFTGLTPDCSYYFSVVAYNGGRTAKSVDYTFTTLNPIPYNVTGIVNYDECDFTWDINDINFGDSIVPEIRIQGSTDWTSGTTLAKNATGHTFTGLTFSTDYQARFVRTYYNPTIFTGCTSYWRFDETSGIDCRNEFSTTGGTIGNSIMRNTGKNNNGIRTLGLTNYLFDSNISYGADDIITQNYWINMSHYNVGSYLICPLSTNYKTTNGFLYYFLPNTHTLNYVWYGRWTGAKVSSAIPEINTDNVWKMITIIDKGTSIELYINAVLKYTYTGLSATRTKGGHNARMGVFSSSTDTNLYRVVWTDEFSIWNRELSAYEIYSLYRNDNGFFY